MNWQEDDDRYDDADENVALRPKRTKFRPLEDQPYADVNRSKRSGKRSHRQKSLKDEYWSDHDR